MTREEQRERLAAAAVGRLATVSPDGRPHIVPCCFTLLADQVVSVVDAKRKRTPALQRLANVRAHPVATLLVDEYDSDWSRLWWVRVSGTARVVDAGPEFDNIAWAAAIDALVTKYPQYQTARPAGAVLTIDIDEWRSWSAV